MVARGVRRPWIWAVAVGGRLYVRPYNGARSRWYQAALAQRAGQVRVAGASHDVAFAPAEAGVLDAVDEADRVKYAGSPYLPPMIAARTRETTLEIRPRDAVQAYCDSKLLPTTVAFALARRWPGVLSNAVDPGRVATRTGGPQAPDDLELGAETQAWLAAGTSAQVRFSDVDWHHRERRRPLAITQDEAFQDLVVDRLTDLTGVTLPAPPVASPTATGSR